MYLLTTKTIQFTSSYTFMFSTDKSNSQSIVVVILLVILTFSNFYLRVAKGKKGAKF